MGISRHAGPDAVRPVQTQLEADERQDDGQAVAEVHQPAQRRVQDEVERPQAEQGERVGGEDQVRVLGDAVDRRHRVDSEDDVGGQHRDHDQGERGERPLRALPDGHPGAVVVVDHRHDLAQQPHRAHLVDVDLLLVPGEGVTQQLHRGGDQDDREEQEGEVEGLQRGRAEGDEDGPQHQRAGDAVEQHPLGEHRRHRERRQQQHEDEEVVDRERLLHQVTGQVLARPAGSRNATRSRRRTPAAARCRTPTSRWPPAWTPRAGDG